MFPENPTMDPRSTESDAALVERVLAGETESFAELVRRYQSALARVARSRLGRADWAEDVVQETFMAAFKSCGTYDRQYSFRTWLWTILLNQCRSHYMRHKRRVLVETLESGCELAAASDPREPDAASPLSALLAKERAATLESLLRQLSAAQADALRLRFFGGLKFQEIADAMQCSLNTAKARVRNGLERMAHMVETQRAGSALPGESHEER
jgi:RNA polymerase sigma-70 factor (ECF subfamily)